MQAPHLMGPGLMTRLDNDLAYDPRGSLDELSQLPMYHPPPPMQPIPNPLPTQTMPSMHRLGIMSEVEQEECKVINEFCHILEKSKQLFNGLRFVSS